METMEELDRQLEEWSSPLRQLLEQEEARQVDLRAQLKASESRSRRIERTLRSIRPDEERKPKGKSKSKRNSNDWTPSAEVLGQVAEYFAEHGEATYPDLVEATGRAKATVERAVAVLRAEEKVRRAGFVGDGPGKRMLFKAMEGTHA